MSKRTTWERIQEGLRDAGLPDTQKSVENHFGIKQGSISGWNRVGGGPSLPNARKIGSRLNLCVEWILTERGPKRPGPPMEPAAQTLWDLWGRISEGDRHEIVGFARAKAVPIQASRRGR